MPIPKDDKIVKWRSAKEQVFVTMQRWIIEGYFKSGEKVSDIEIAEFFGISRTPVREALQLLEGQMLVKSYPGKATVVTEIDTDNIEQWYAPMKVLQQLGISLAVDAANESHLKVLRDINEQFRKELEVSDNIINTLNLDKRFHEYLLQISGNKYILDFCNTLWIHIQRLEYAFFKENSLSFESYEEHQKFIDAIERKDSFSAGMLLQRQNLF